MAVRPELRHFSWVVSAATVVVLLGVSAHVARAEFVLTDLETNILKTAGTFSAPVGWEFVPTQAISVTKLGFFDSLNDGLAHSHTLALFDVLSRSLIISAIIDEGTTAPAEGEPVTIDGDPSHFVMGTFRYVPIQPVTLQAGRHYIVYGTPEGGVDAYATFQNQPFGVASEIQLLQQRISLPNLGLFFPLRTDPPGFYDFGPTFQFNPVPEPATFALAALGIVALTFTAARRRLVEFAWTNFTHHKTPAA